MAGPQQNRGTAGAKLIAAAVRDRSKKEKAVAIVATAFLLALGESVAPLRDGLYCGRFRACAVATSTAAMRTLD